MGFQLDADYDYWPNRRYYGIGNDTPEANVSYFLLAHTNAEAALRLGASPLRQLRIVGGYLGLSPGAGYNGHPLLETVFAPADAPYAQQSAQELWYGLMGDLGTIDDMRDPSSGVLARIDLRRARGLHATDPDYYQWRAEGRVPPSCSRRAG